MQKSIKLHLTYTRLVVTVKIIDPRSFPSVRGFLWATTETEYTHSTLHVPDQRLQIQFPFILLLTPQFCFHKPLWLKSCRNSHKALNFNLLQEEKINGANFTWLYNNIHCSEQRLSYYTITHHNLRCLVTESKTKTKEKYCIKMLI